MSASTCSIGLTNISKRQTPETHTKTSSAQAHPGSFLAFDVSTYMWWCCQSLSKILLGNSYSKVLNLADTHTYTHKNSVETMQCNFYCRIVHVRMYRICSFPGITSIFQKTPMNLILQCLAKTILKIYLM